MQNDLSNSDFQKFGRDAAQAWKQSDASGTKGDQLAVFALVQAWHRKNFTCEVVNRKGEVEEQYEFDLQKYVEHTPYNADGSKNVRIMKARTACVASEVFGIGEADLSNAVKQRIGRAMEVTAYLCGLGYSDTDVRMSKRNKLEVPYVALNDEPSEEDGENARKLYDAMASETVELDGKEGRTIAALQRRAKPKTLRHAKDTSSNSEEASFKASVEFVTKHLAPIALGADECAVALTEELRRDLWKLNNVLVAYFQADPVEDEKPAAKHNTRASK